MIFVFIVMLFGLWTVFRTSDIFVHERFLARYQQIYLILMLVCVQFLVSRYIFDSYLAMWTLAWLPFLLSKLCFKVLIFTREKGFKDIFCQLLDEIIIEMRSGQSFRASIARANEKMPPFVQQKIVKVVEMIRFSTPSRENKDPFISMIVEEFRKIDANSHNSLQRLLSFRHKLRTESDYRRRSGQVVLQIRVQAGILVALYFATAVFVFLQTPASNLGMEILLSFFLFFVGTAIVFLYGRSYKWKV